MTAIKICGIKDEKTCDLLVELQVDWLGLVFYPASPRYISIDQASQLPDYKKHGLLKVGLFVKPTIDDIKKVLDKVSLDILQIYSSVEIAEAIRREFDLPVWLAKGIQTAADLPQKCSVDAFIIEAPANQGDTRPGGNGRSFDWRLTHGWAAPQPWVLAGGLTSDNVVHAIKQSGTHAVDVSSGVEREKGIKDPALIQQFVKNIRDFDLNHLQKQ